MDVRFFETPAEFRAWLEANHETATELWVGFHKKATGRSSITWPEAVDQALCFGWIDGIRKSVDENSYTNRFTPRRPTSNWSLVNVKRVGELTDAGLMAPAGLRAFALRDEARTGVYSSEQRPDGAAAGVRGAVPGEPAGLGILPGAAARLPADGDALRAEREAGGDPAEAAGTLIEDSANGRRIGLLARPARGS